MKAEIGIQDTDMLCLNIVETINTYFDKYPKGKILKKDYEDMVVKITNGLNKINETEVVSNKESSYYIG